MDASPPGVAELGRHLAGADQLLSQPERRPAYTAQVTTLDGLPKPMGLGGYKQPNRQRDDMRAGPGARPKLRPKPGKHIQESGMEIET